MGHVARKPGITTMLYFKSNVSKSIPTQGACVEKIEMDRKLEIGRKIDGNRSEIDPQKCDGIFFGPIFNFFPKSAPKKCDGCLLESICKLFPKSDPEKCDGFFLDLFLVNKFVSVSRGNFRALHKAYTRVQVEAGNPTQGPTQAPTQR